LIGSLHENTVVCPDVMIVCGKFEEDFLHFPPVLILEIASDKTRLKDHNVKFKLYEDNGMRFYLMADIERKSIEVFKLTDNRYKEINSFSFQLSSSCTIELDVERIWQ
jgi:Uma2 family endonuclease